jgi:hypothetical protein
MKQYYAVVKQEQSYSKYGGSITAITLIGLHDRQEYKTYIDPSNFNADHWGHIIRHPEHGFILGNLKTKRKLEKLIINADSDPIIAWEHDNIDALVEAVIEKWRQEDQTKHLPKFDDFFGEQ